MEVKRQRRTPEMKLREIDAAELLRQVESAFEAAQARVDALKQRRAELVEETRKAAAK